MSEPFETDSATNATEYTVSEISGALKRTVEDAFGNVRVRGEISGYRGPHSSGHAYFALKDDRARIEAVIWRGTMSRLRFRPEEGMEVIASGKLTTYPGSSKYQIVIDNLEPAGAGALMALLEERKRRLQAEGLFDAARKRPLPYMPGVIGVITSPTGAVIRDILHRIKDRFPLHVIVWPVRVQGETTGAEVSAAVQGFNALGQDGAIRRPDLLIVARGGGSLEDLWGFNDEILARAVAQSAIPVISAVGHETDWTLIDYVADVRAPTPTGAAEIAVPVKAELEATLANFAARLGGGLSRHVERKRAELRAAARVLPSADQLFAGPRRSLDEVGGRLGRALDVSAQAKRSRYAAVRLTPATLVRRFGEAKRNLAASEGRIEAALRGLLRTHRAHLDQIARRVSVEPVGRRTTASRERLSLLVRRRDQAFLARFERLHRQLSQCERLLSSLSHQAVLARGFALVLDSDGSLIKQAREVSAGQRLAIQFADGKADAIATGGEDRPARPRTKPSSGSGGQGSLF
ncbi:MAG: exodeoxyribonuclease VII large subunit [Rhizobiaceae bacterium]|nr:exodeoxyribonuclease VII large subunit [Rhizobiaceae bacterium]